MSLALAIDFKKVTGIFTRANLARLARVRSQQAHLQQEEQEIIQGLRDNIRFQNIAPTKENAPLIAQLEDLERVHLPKEHGEIPKKRMGEDGDNKRCLSLVSLNGRPLVTSAIYTALFDVSDKGEKISYADIPGNINETKDMPVKPFVVTKDTKTIVCLLYAVSSNEFDWGIGARPLAGGVYKNLHDEAKAKGYNLIISSLSPVRNTTPINFADWLKGHSGFENMFDDSKEASDELMAYIQDEENQNEIRALLLQYLITQRDPIMNFHLGNGAYIGDIKFNPDNKEDWVLINYVYPGDPEVREQNQNFYVETKTRLMAPHLEEFLEYDYELFEKSGIFLDDMFIEAQPLLTAAPDFVPAN